MSLLSNPRHEAFAQALAKGKTADEAYALAGFKPNRGNATRLKANDSIQKRVQELQSRVAEKAEWSAADRLKSLRAIHDATEGQDPRTAIAAIAEANKMAGSYAPAKRELSGPGGGPIPVVDLSKATDDQLATLEAFFGPLALAGGDDEGDTDGEAEAGG